LDVAVPEPALPPIDISYENNQLTIIVSANTGNYQYSIDGGITFQDSNVFNDISGTTFNVVVINEDGCEVANVVLFVDAVQEPKNDTAPLLEIWPNPNDGKFTFETKLPIGDYQIRITDAVGKTVFNGKANFDSANRQELDLTWLPNGCYLIRVGDGQAWAIQKFVILK
jgi:hypothetical protein